MDVEQLNAAFVPMTDEEAATLEDARKPYNGGRPPGTSPRRKIKDAKATLNAQKPSLSDSELRKAAVRDALETLHELTREGQHQHRVTSARALLQFETKLQERELKARDNSWMFDGRKRL